MPRKIPKPQIHPTSLRLAADLQCFIDEQATKQKRSRQFVITEILEQWKAFETAKGKAKANKD